MNWDDKGFLISKNKYNENSLIAEIYTQSHGKVSGIIFGGTSKKIKNYLQIGNKLHVSFNSKSDSQIGYFKLEIEKALSPIYFEEKKKLCCILSAMSLVKILTAEFQKNEKIFELILDFYEFLGKDTLRTIWPKCEFTNVMRGLVFPRDCLGNLLALQRKVWARRRGAY